MDPNYGIIKLGPLHKKTRAAAKFSNVLYEINEKIFRFWCMKLMKKFSAFDV